MPIGGCQVVTRGKLQRVESAQRSAAFFFDLQTAQTEIVRQVHGLVGSEGAKPIQAVFAGSHNARHGVLATVVGLVILLFGASAVLIELRDALNTTWDLPAAAQTPLPKIMSLVRARLFSFALVLAIGFLLLVSLGLNASLAPLGRLFQGMLPASGRHGPATGRGPSAVLCGGGHSS
jgi:membrane protein